MDLPLLCQAPLSGGEEFVLPPGSPPCPTLGPLQILLALMSPVITSFLSCPCQTVSHLPVDTALGPSRSSVRVGFPGLSLEPGQVNYGRKRDFPQPQSFPLPSPPVRMIQWPDRFLKATDSEQLKSQLHV